MNIPLNNLNNNSVKGSALWQLAFRPCFLLANVYAVVVMVLWLLMQQGVQFNGLNHYGINFWHAHEMIFAYALMVIAGFLLTAIKNWTGVQTAQGFKLQLLVGFWLIARLVFLVPNVPVTLVALIDMSFPLLLILFVAQPLVKVGNKRNYMMIAIVSVLALFNGVFHYAVISGQMQWVPKVLLLALMLVLLLISVMAGRVFPMFSQNGVANRYQARIYPNLEKVLPVAMLSLAVIWVFFSHYKWLLLLVAFINFVLHGWRLVGWYNGQVWQKPFVWELQLGYAFLVLGFAVVAASALLPWLHFIAIHVFTVGALGLITLGMMARVSLGHTGRNLHQPPKVLAYCFGLLTLSAITRVVLPMMNVLDYSTVILVSGLLWVLAFGLLVIKYVPIWWRPRVDGQPG